MDLSVPLSFIDIFFGTIFALVIIGVGMIVTRDSPDRRVIRAFIVYKVVVCFVFSFILYYLYEGGDGFHENGIIYSAMIQEDFTNGTIEYLTKDAFFMPGGNSTYRCRSLSGLVHFLTFDMFLASSLVFAMFGSFGQWWLYRTFITHVPDPRVRIWWMVGILFMPSLAFWSAGLLKDPVGFWGLGCAVWGMSRFLKTKNPYNVIRILIGVYTLTLFRGQVVPVLLLSVVPMVLLPGSGGPWPGRTRGGKVSAPGRIVRLSLIALFIGLYWLSTSLNTEFSADAIQANLIHQRNQYYAVSSRMTILEDVDKKMDMSTTGFSSLLSMWPEAVVFTLYRPFLWEGFGSPVVMVAAIENSVLLVLSLRAIALLVFDFRVALKVFRDPLFLTCAIFVGGFAFGLGIATPNLGAVSRYRLPLMPFFIGMFAIIEYHRRSSRDALPPSRPVPASEMWGRPGPPLWIPQGNLPVFPAGPGGLGRRWRYQDRPASGVSEPASRGSPRAAGLINGVGNRPGCGSDVKLWARKEKY